MALGAAPLSSGLPAVIARAPAEVVNPDRLPASLRSVASDGLIASYDLAGIEGRHAMAVVIAWRPAGPGAEAAIESALARAVPSARRAGALAISGQVFTLWRFGPRDGLAGGMAGIARLDGDVLVTVASTGAVSNRGVLRKAVRAIAGRGPRARVPAAAPLTPASGRAKEAQSCWIAMIPMDGFPNPSICGVETLELRGNPIGIPGWLSCATRLGPQRGLWYTWAPNGNWRWYPAAPMPFSGVVQYNGDAWGSNFAAIGMPDVAIVQVACSHARRPGS